MPENHKPSNPLIIPTNGVIITPETLFNDMLLDTSTPRLLLPLMIRSTMYLPISQ